MGKANFGDLVDWQIQEYINTGGISLIPFKKENIQPNTYDLRLADEFIEFSAPPQPSSELYILDPYNKDSYDEIMNSPYTKKIKGEKITLLPGRFYLASTLERVALAPFIKAVVDGKSSLARIGIVIHQTGGFIDAGFRGHITLEITNVFPWPVILYAGMNIAQLSFTRTAECEVPYNLKKGAKYNNQEGPTTSKYFLNAELSTDIYTSGNR